MAEHDGIALSDLPPKVALCKSNRDYLQKISSEAVAKQAHDDVTKLTDVQVQPSRKLRRDYPRNRAGVIRGEIGMYLRRDAIIETFGVKGNKSGENAVDNRLRELKQRGSVLHERN